MRTAFCFVALVAFALLQCGQAQNAINVSNPTTSAAVAPSDSDSATTTKSPVVKCDFACPRIYQPLCARFNGVPTTFENKCMLRGKIRCARLQFAAGIGEKAQVGILYQGRCREQA